MKQVIAVFALIRWKNLLLLLLVLLFSGVCLFRNPSFSCISFVIWIIMAILIAAAGYAINDYFDRVSDAVNRPKKIVKLQFIKPKEILFIWLFFNGLALLLALWLSFWHRNSLLWALPLLTLILLFLYSFHLKCSPVAGNIVVALLAGIAVAYPGMNFIENQFMVTQRLPIVIGYIIFSFVTTWLRETLKTIEDMPGDELAGCHTVAVKYGVTISKNIALILSTTLVLLLVVATIQSTLLWQVMVLPGIGLTIFSFILIPMILKANQPADFKKLQHYCKWIMFAGILTQLFWMNY